MRSSYRTISETNKRITKDEDISFLQGIKISVGDDNEYKQLIESYPWLTYRSDFEEIGGFTSDSGWG